MLRSEPPAVPSTSDPHVPRKSDPDKDCRAGQTENISQLRNADIRPEGRFAGQTQVSPQFRHEGPGYLRPLPASSVILASNEADNSRPTIPKAKLDPLIPFRQGRFSGSTPKARDTIREPKEGDE